MQHLYRAWEEFSAEIRAAGPVLLLSDYDGTLTPIVSRPEDAVLSPEVREKLETLARHPAFSVGIVSGRQLAELRSLVAVEDIYYAGNHGLEIEGPGLSFVNEIARQARSEMERLAAEFSSALGGIQGVIVEDKGLSLSVHYRMVREKEQPAVISRFTRLTTPLVREGKIKVSSGKMVLEVRPPVDWHKGKAVESIRREIDRVRGGPSLPIYLGDDTTDEDAFKVTRRPDGWSIFVGGDNPASSAEYYLESTAEVADFLGKLPELKGG